MKICFLRTDYAFGLKFGGSVSHISGFIKHIKKLGHEIFIVSTDKLIHVDEPTFVIKPPALLRGTVSVQKILFNYIFVKKALDFVVKKKPDFIYQRHSIHNFSGVKLSRKTGIPLVLEVNASEVWTEKHWGGLRFEKLAASIENMCFDQADVIMVISNAVKRQLVDLGVDSDKICVNPNGVDQMQFNPSVDGEPVRSKYNLGDKIVVGFVGTFSQYHGISVLGKAIKVVVEANPDVHFMMIGKGPLKETFEKIIQADGVTDHVTEIEMVPHSEIQNYLAACDILTAPQTKNEDGSDFFGSPTKLFEYMGMGKAVVASSVGQMREILEDGKNAVLVEQGDSVKLAQGIIKVAADKRLRVSLGREARRFVISNYTWEHNARRVIDAYQDYKNLRECKDR